MFGDLAQFASWLSNLAGGAVHGGYLTAMAFICVLQYAVHLWRLRRSTATLRHEIEEMQTDFDIARRERSLARLETDVLQEFAANADCDAAICSLLRRFVPNTQHDFAVFLRFRNGTSTIEHRRGLSGESDCKWKVDADLINRMASGLPFVLEGRKLRGNPFLASLAAVDRRKAERLILIGIPDRGELLGAFATTKLFPQNLAEREQLDLARRLAAGIGGTLHCRNLLSEHETQLRHASKVLELRDISDSTFETPLEMLREFVQELGSNLRAASAALYIAPGPVNLADKVVIRWGGPSQIGVKEQWHRYEEWIATASLKRKQTMMLDRHGLAELNISNLLEHALAVPLLKDRVPIGCLCLTRRGHEPFSDADVQLAGWSAEHLAGTILQVLNRAQIEHLARIDGLTQLANRTTFDEAIAREIGRADSEQTACSLVMFDLDHFKSVNDVYGHQAGDRVLRAVAEVLRACAAATRVGQDCILPRQVENLPHGRAGDHLIARYGGEEFAILLPGIGIAGAVRVAESARKRIESGVTESHGRRLGVTASVGVASFPAHASDVEGLIAAADAALYQAKADGRNRVNEARECAAVGMA